MANTKSAKKRIVTNEKRRSRNRHNRSRMRTEMRRFRELLDEGNVEAATQKLATVYAVIDRTAQKGVIHPSAGARFKSRLTRQLNQTAQASTAE